MDLERRREQRAWYFYDWANSGFLTTTGTVLFGPYLTVVAKRAACPGQSTDLTCDTNLSVLGIPVDPGSLALYTITLATVVSVLWLPIVGAIADRSGQKRKLLARFAWIGATAGAAMVFVAGSNWQLGCLLMIAASLMLGSSLVIYDAILIDIAEPDERDAISSRGWAFGYAGAAILLTLNLILVTAHDAVGVSEEAAVRISMLSAGLWWAAFTVIPYLGLRDRPPGVTTAGTHPVRESFAQLRTTIAHARGYPQTLLFLLAYLAYNDGIQTVIYASSIYGQEELGLPQSSLIVAILVVQFVAIAGALLFGRAAARYGSKNAVLTGLVLWCGVVALGYLVPDHALLPFIALASLIGLVMGGTQALSRSLYSQLIPRGREAEYFSLYQAAERGTSWFGTLAFGLVHQLTDSYRLAIVVLVIFFVIGGTLLSRLDVRKGITAAGNAVPAVI